MKATTIFVFYILTAAAIVSFSHWLEQTKLLHCHRVVCTLPKGPCNYETADLTAKQSTDYLRSSTGIHIVGVCDEAHNVPTQ